MVIGEEITLVFRIFFSFPFTDNVRFFSEGGGINRVVKYSPSKAYHPISPLSENSKGSIFFFGVLQPGVQPEEPVPPRSFFSTFWFLKKAYFKPKSLFPSSANLPSSILPIHWSPNWTGDLLRGIVLDLHLQVDDVLIRRKSISFRYLQSIL